MKWKTCTHLTSWSHAEELHFVHQSDSMTRLIQTRIGQWKEKIYSTFSLVYWLMMKRGELWTCTRANMISMGMQIMCYIKKRQEGNLKQRERNTINMFREYILALMVQSVYGKSSPGGTTNSVSKFRNTSLYYWNTAVNNLELVGTVGHVLILNWSGR